MRVLLELFGGIFLILTYIVGIQIFWTACKYRLLNFKKNPKASIGLIIRVLFSPIFIIITNINGIWNYPGEEIDD